MIHQQAVWRAAEFVFDGIKRYWYIAAGTAGAVLLVTFASVLMLPRSYTSEAKLLIKFGRENNIDPTASNGTMVSVYESRENEINSLLEVLHSRQLLAKVVQDLGPEFVLFGRPKPAATAPESATTLVSTVPSNPSAPGESNLSPAGQRATTLGVPSKLEQLAIQKLEASLSAHSPRKSHVIAISCKSDRPETAQTIVARLLEAYLAEHLRVHHTVGSYEFFAQQTQQGRDEWERKATDLRSTKDRLGIVSLAGQLKQLQDSLDGIEARLLAGRADLATSENRLAALREALSRQPERVDSQFVRGPSASSEGMRQTLFQLHGREKEMTARMTDRHPLLQAVRQQLDETSDILDQQENESTQTTQATNPSYQAIQLQLQQEEATAKGLRGLQAALLRERSDCREKLSRLRADEFKLATLEREVEQAESRYRGAAEKLEQARINRSLDEEQISSLNIVQPASYNPKAGGPKRSLTLAFGLFVALGGGLGAALGLHWLNPQLRTREQLATQLDLPVLGVAPAFLAAVR